MANVAQNEAVNVRLRFTTRENELELEDAAPVLIPTTFKRYQLSQYVNSQLTLDKPVPFEFLINGSYLRTTLDEYLSENGISAENILSVEYVRARIPPQYVASYEHDDWVSSVHTSYSEAAGPRQPRILTASYDGRVRVWNTSSQVLSTSSENNHMSFVKSAKFVSPTQIVSTGFDRTVRLWKYKESDDGLQGDLTPSMELYGHTGSVDAVDTNAKAHRLVTASADSRVGYWSTRKSDMSPADEELIPRTITKEGKRRKLNTAISVPRCGPISMMSSHAAPVTAVCFDAKEPSFAHSASFDHTIRTWDLEQAKAVDTRTTSSPLFCVEQMPSMQLLAAGSAGRDVKLVDPRDSAVTVVAMTLRGHQNHVVSLAKDPSNEYVLASGSHDGTCRVWDVRSTKSSKDGVVSQSIYTLPRASLKGRACPSTGEGVKVFSVCWDRQIGLLSAGEDKAVQVNSSDSIT